MSNPTALGTMPSSVKGAGAGAVTPDTSGASLAQPYTTCLDRVLESNNGGTANTAHAQSLILLLACALYHGKSGQGRDKFFRRGGSFWISLSEDPEAGVKGFSTPVMRTELQYLRFPGRWSGRFSGQFPGRFPGQWSGRFPAFRRGNWRQLGPVKPPRTLFAAQAPAVAKCSLTPAPKSAQKVTGKILLRQNGENGDLKVFGFLKGFKTIARSAANPQLLHAIHIHERNNDPNGCSVTHGPGSDFSEFGDFAQTRTGGMRILHRDSQNSLFGAESIIGHTIVVYEGPDQGNQGGGGRRGRGIGGGRGGFGGGGRGKGRGGGRGGGNGAGGNGNGAGGNGAGGNGAGGNGAGGRGGGAAGGAGGNGAGGGSEHPAGAPLACCKIVSV